MNLAETLEQHHGWPSQEAKRRSPLKVEVMSSLDSLVAIEKDWRRLTPKTAAPFQTFTWNLAWYRNFLSEESDMRVLVFCCEGRIVAILPGYSKGNQIRLAGDCTCDYQDLLAENESLVPGVLEALSGWQKRDAPRQYFFFEKLSSEGLLHRSLVEENVISEGMLMYSRCYAPCPFVLLRGGLEDYLSSLPARVRQDFRRSLKRLDRECPVSRVEIFRDLSIRVDTLTEAAAFHSRHFRKEGVSPLGDPRLLRLLGEVAKDEDVGFHFSRLTSQSDILAVDFGFVRGGSYYGYLTGFHPAFQKLAPGKCLLLRRIDEWVRKDKIHTLDFLAGDEGYKRDYTGGASYAVCSVHLMPDTFAHRARKASLVVARQGRQVAKQAIEKVSLAR